jgi:flap endonuclease-1
MGIRYLNNYLRSKCHNSIRVLNISEISGKKIAVDISIYLYKYEADEMLLENMYLMLSIFRYYNVIPIFIFDGKPPPEKKELLNKRKEDKKEAQQEYNELKKTLENNADYDETEKQDIINTMDQLKKQFVNVNKYKIEKVKDLIRAYGATYYDAPGEADELCALLVLKKIVWACLSEDMDMFVYGCSRVIRYFSLINHSIVLYSMKDILKELDMTHENFKDICILSGTDYNIHANTMTQNSRSKNKNQDINLYDTLKLFQKYKDEQSNNKQGNNKQTNNKNQDNGRTFYQWLQNNTDYISDLELLEKINKMFDLSVEHCSLDVFKHIKIINGQINNKLLHEIMREEGFIFIT